MRHRKKGRTLGRSSSHRKALARNLLRSLLEHGTIVTTLAKAKEYAPHADKLITIAKRAEVKAKELAEKLEDSEQENTEQQVNALRAFYFKKAFSILRDRKLVQRLFYDIAPQYAGRAGGYTQVLHLDKTRLGDNARQAVLKLVEELPEESEREKTAEELNQEKERRKQEEKKKKEKEKKQKARAKEKDKAKKAKQKNK
ncbi:50S ribosomal protein L17 [Candidatus Uabimicrobium sp. HlEnr_7]|uniref:50S ribosomal protein L17 n=1 Tax=Candidatus Uabimicrobium helgolandensis TaxID=3095367 RepID=UPI003556708E